MTYHIDADKVDSIGRLSQSEKVLFFDENRAFGVFWRSNEKHLPREGFQVPISTHSFRFNFI